MEPMDDADRTRGIAEYIVDRIDGAVELYREIFADVWPERQAAADRNIGYLARRAGEICAGSAADPAAFAEQYRSVLWMTPAEIIMDVLRKAG